MTITETTESGAAADASVVEAARLLLERMGLRPEDLLAAPAPARTPAPTFAEFIAVLVDASPPGTKVYRPYWKRIVAAWGERRLDEPTPSDIRGFIAAMKANDVVTTRVNYRGGVTAERHVVGAFRCLYAHAEADGLVTENPAQKVRKPRRPASTRRALPDAPRGNQLRGEHHRQ
jgi:integrase/recombinase XerC